MIGSFSVLVSMTAQWSYAAYASGTIALIGSLVSLSADFTTRLEAGTSRTLFEVYNELVEIGYKDVKLARDLTAPLDAWI